MDELITQEQNKRFLNQRNIVTILIFAIIAIGIILSLAYFKVLPLTPSAPIAGPADKTTAAPTPTVFPYDTVKAEKLLTDYLKENVKPEYVPEKTEIKQGPLIASLGKNLKNQFSFYTVIQNSTLSANFTYKEDVNDPNDFAIFIQPANIESTTLTASLTNSVLASYFINPYAVSDCQTKDVASACENFQIVNDGKRGYGMASDGQKFVLFTCYIPTESKDYETLESCINR